MKETFMNKFEKFNHAPSIFLLFEDEQDIQLSKPQNLDINYYLSRYKIDLENPPPARFANFHTLND